MKGFFRILLSALSAILSVVFATPPMPEAVQAGDDVVKHLWGQASKDVFIHELYPTLNSKALRWGMFLYNDGESIVDDFYRDEFPHDRDGVQAIEHGKDRFLQAVRFENKNAYELTDDVERRLAFELIRRFAEDELRYQKEIEEKYGTISAENPSLGLPGSSTSDHIRDASVEEHHSLTPPDTSGSDSDH